MSLPSEQWRPIPGYEGLYEVSDQGRVNTLPRWRVKPGIHQGEVRPSDGYVAITLRKEGHRRHTKAHILVMLAFVGPRPERQDIRHKNGDRSDNRLANLEYGTRSQNLYDAVNHGTHHWAKKTHCPKGHPYDAANTGWYHRHRRCRACQNKRERASRRTAA